MNINETIRMSANSGLEVDFTGITYKDPSFSGPSWLVAHITINEIKELCGIEKEGGILITEDEVEVALKKWLSNSLKGEVANFRWMWDLYHFSVEA